MAEIKNAYPPFVNPYKRKVGRPLKYTPRQLAEEFEKYVQWCQDNPIVISKTATGKMGGNPFNRDEDETKPRLISIGGFLVWLGEDEVWWSQLENGKEGIEFSKVKSRVRVYCEDYQKAMASAGVFKENIISRLLGLAEKQNIAAQVEGKVEYKVTFED